MLVLNGKKTIVMSVLDIIRHFCDFRIDSYTRKILFLLNKVRERSHILIGLCVTVRNIDEIIKIIKSSSEVSEARQKILEKLWTINDISDLIEMLMDDKSLLKKESLYQLTDKQVSAILEMKLQKLTGLEYEKIINEIKTLSLEINHYQTLLSSKSLMINEIMNEMQEIKDKFSTPRRTVILPDEDFSSQNNIENILEKKDMIVTITMNNYIKSVPLDTYRSQDRGGKGKMSQNMYDDDTVMHLFATTNHDSMMFFSNKGKVYKIDVYKLPVASQGSRGKSLANFLSLENNEKITSIVEYKKNKESLESNIVFITSKGNARRNDWSDFINVPSNGKIAMKLTDDEELIKVLSCNDDSDILICTAFGKAIRFSIDNLRIFKSRNSSGVRGINLARDDFVVSSCILKSNKISSEERESFLNIPLNIRVKIANDEKLTKTENEMILSSGISEDRALLLAKNEEFLLTTTENGCGKRTSVYEYRLTNRGGMGIINIITSSRNGNVISTMPIASDNEIILIANTGMIIRVPVNTVRIIGRNSKGVKIFNLQKDAKLVSTVKIIDSKKTIDE